jgi:hypothetical protein
LVESLCSVLNLTKAARICGVSYKDASTLERLRKRGCQYTWCLDPASDLGITDPKAGIETMQERLHPGVVSGLRQKYGAPDVVIARHILEHAHDTLSFIAALRQLVSPGGYVVFEVPDCTPALEALDYTTVWEEHVLYFTPETLRHCLGFGGLSLVHFTCYPYPYENSLVGIGQAQSAVTPTFPAASVLEPEERRAQVFSQALAKRRHLLSQFLAVYGQSHGRVAIFGAGHPACTFINLMGLKDHIAFVVDDHPHKQGLFMPGSRLPIYGSATLLKEDIKLCLMSLNPDSEAKVIQKNQAFLAQGGTLTSIFPASRHALQI